MSALPDTAPAPSSCRHVFISPHLDDVALSCGGSVAHRSAEGAEALVVTVFAGDPDPAGLSPFARCIHALWGDPPAPYAVRRVEDRVAMHRLGAHPVHLGFLDAIYRVDPAGEPLYTTNATLFDRVHPADADLIDRMAQVLRALTCRVGPTVVYAPLGVGRHVDHQVVTQAAMRLQWMCAAPPQVLFYEDFPYAAGLGPTPAADTVEAALARLGAEGWRPHLIAVDPQPRLDAIACYASQLPSLFVPPHDMETTVTGYAAALALERGFSERFWQPE